MSIFSHEANGKLTRVLGQGAVNMPSSKPSSRMKLLKSPPHGSPAVPVLLLGKHRMCPALGPSAAIDPMCIAEDTEKKSTNKATIEQVRAFGIAHVENDTWCMIENDLSFAKTALQNLQGLERTACIDSQALQMRFAALLDTLSTAFNALGRGAFLGRHRCR